MKKKTAVCLVILLITVLLGSGAFVFANYSQGTSFEVDENGVTCSLKTYDESAEGRVEIPQVFNGTMVTGISADAFLKCENVTEVVVPKTIVKIGDFSLGYIMNENGEKVKKENFVIWGRAGSEAQKYAEANGIEFNVFLTQPTLKSAKSAVSGILVSWTATENAAGYNVYRKTAESKWRFISFAEGERTNKFVDTSAKSGVEYIYTVRAVNGEMKSACDKTGVSVHYVASPKVTLKNVTDGVNVSWTKVKNATVYRVYKKPAGATSWVRLKTVRSNVFSYVDETAISGEKACYCVVAAENDYKSSYVKDRENIFLSEPVVSSAKNLTNGIKIYWNKIAGTQKYRIYRRVNGGSWVKIADVSNKYLTYVDKSVTVGAKYTYTVRAVSDKNISSYNKGVSTYRLSHPVLSGISAQSNGLKISWNKATLAEKYAVYRKNASGNWVRIHVTKNNSTYSYVDTTAVSGNTYTYTVVALYKNVKSGYNNNGVTASFFASPRLISARCMKSEKIVLTWESLGGAQSYIIYKREINGRYSSIATVNSNVLSYTDKNIAVGKEYAYVIRAKSASGLVSGNSNTKTARVLDLNKPMVALTYDDGPSNEVTTRVLNTLEKYDARATFFVVGSRVNSYKSQIKRAYNLKCEIGNHTYNHATLTSLSGAGVKKELSDTDARVRAITGENPVIMRPPGGSYNNSTVKNNTAYPIIMWSVDTRDWENRNSSKIVANIKNNVRDGSIVLMHDLYDSTASATEIIVPWLIQNGYQLVTVTELMDAKGINMKDGVAYNSAK